MAHAVNFQDNLDPVLDDITVPATAATSQNDFVIEGPWFGVALNDAEIGEDLSIDIAQNKRCVGYSEESVGAAMGDALYLNPTTGVYAAAAASGFYLVGYTTQVKDANDYFEFIKLEYPIAYTAPLSLNDLADVNITDLAENEILKANASDIFVNAADATA
jgi:predicted RecA/RadA family phage recombinase